MGIREYYNDWVEAEANAQVGAETLAEAREARSRFLQVAADIQGRLPFKTRIGVRIIASPRVDAAEHIIAKDGADVPAEAGRKPFRRAPGTALCNQKLAITEDGEGVEVRRRAPSCLRCLLVAERLLEVEK